MTESKRGGPGRGQGRKPLADDAPSVVFTMRLTPAQRFRLLELGGAAWVRAQIAAARFAIVPETAQLRGKHVPNCGAETAKNPDAS